MSYSRWTVQSKVQKETSPFQVTAQVMTAANYDAWHTAADALETAMDAILVGVIRDKLHAADDVELSGALPASNFARRETKLLIRYHDTTTNDKYRAELACPDLAALTMESGDANFVVLADGGVMEAFVTAFEAHARSTKTPANAVAIDTIQVVGRNL